MKDLSLIKNYEKFLLKNNYYSNNLQRKVVILLDKIRKNLILKKKPITLTINFILKFLLILINKKKYYFFNRIKGLYIWGGVGIGKTWIMDLFFQSINYDRKLRLHFNHFMMYVNKELIKLEGRVDPLLIIANQIKKKLILYVLMNF